MDVILDVGLPRGFWDLSNKEMEEVFIRNSDYTALHFCHRFVKKNLEDFLSARDTLQVHGEYPTLDECRANYGFVSGLYEDRPHASSRPTWYRKVDARHDYGLQHVKVHSAKSAWMLEKLSRELIAASVRASVVTGFVIVANTVVPWIASPGALTVGPVNILTWSLGLSTGIAVMTFFSLWLVRRCFHKAKRLGSIVRNNAHALEHKEVQRWGGWDWTWIDEVAVPHMMTRFPL